MKRIEQTDIKALKKKAREVRIDIIKMLAEAGSGHPGGSLSAVEVLVALFFSWMRHDPDNAHWEERDRFVLSKGHGCPVLYSVLAHCGCGFRTLKHQPARSGRVFQSPRESQSPANWTEINIVSIA